MKICPDNMNKTAARAINGRDNMNKTADRAKNINDRLKNLWNQWTN